ncbi:MAG: late competence development ComFB family protein [Desulfovibrio sp.]|uniref:late competence development ComFB family protein n=1 Tax=Desulfovibrio sp. 7SRBS1 TaxID=3378064 RepID=UPI003B4245E4
MNNEAYSVRGTSLQDVRNKNELRVISLLSDILDEYPDYSPTPLEIQDIYALALNLTPARYVQSYSFVIREPVTDEQLQQVIRRAVDRVRSHPKSDEY